MQEGDETRHKSRCIYYIKETKHCKTAKSSYYKTYCGGSSHCDAYQESLKPSPQKVISQKYRIFSAKNDEAKANIIKKVSKKYCEQDDYVTVRGVEDKEEKVFKLIISPIGKETKILQICRGKKVGDFIWFKQKQYEIIGIEQEEKF